MGCIGYNQGKVEYVRVRDIKIDNASNCRIRWVGGLVGYGERPLEHCSAVGSEGNRNGSEAFTFEISISSSSTSASEYTGGQFGICNYITRAISMHNTVNQPENGAYGSGGVMATAGNWGISWVYVEDCDVTTKGKAAGGISAYNDGYRQCVVSSRITATTMAGGLGGVSPWTTYHCKVEGCTIKADTYAGGLIGYALNSSNDENYLYDCVVNTTTVSGGTGSEYIGGAIGANYGKNIYQVVVDDSVTVTGGNNVGGIFGSAAGGSYYGLEAGAEVHGTGNYTGGLAGRLIGYMQNVVSPQYIYNESGTTLNLTHPRTEVNRIIVGGRITGNAYVGGLTGLFDPGSRPINPDNGDPLDDSDSGYIGYINNQHYNKVVIAPVSINGTTNVAAVYTNSSNATTGNGEGIGYLRVYEGIDGSQSIKTQVNGWTKLSAKLNASNKKLTTEDQKKTYTVDDSWLADEKSYKGNNLATGGLYLRESSNNRFFDTANRGKTEDGTITTFPLLHGQHNDMVLFADRTANIKDTPTSTTTKQVTKPYLFWIYGTVDSVPYGGGDSIRSGSVVQDGILLPKAAKAASGATGISLMSTDAEIAVEPDTLTHYASGIDRLNIDIPEEICGLGLSWKIENADGDITASGDIDDLKASGSTGGPRSLSIRYDYNTYLTLSLMDGEEVYETYAIDPAQSRSCWCATRTIRWRPSSI